MTDEQSALALGRSRSLFYAMKNNSRARYDYIKVAGSGCMYTGWSKLSDKNVELKDSVQQIYFSIKEKETNVTLIDICRDAYQAGMFVKHGKEPADSALLRFLFGETLWIEDRRLRSIEMKINLYEYVIKKYGYLILKKKIKEKL